MNSPSQPESAEVLRKILVAGVILKDGKIFVHRNTKYGLRLEPPGGKLEPGETMEEAVVREIFEEHEVRVRVLKKIGVYQTDMTKEGIFDVHTFLCEIVEGEPKFVDDGKNDGFEWLAPEDLEARTETTLSLRSTVPDIRALMN